MSWKTLTFLITKTNRLVLFSGKVSEFSENDRNTPTHTLW